MLVIVGCYINQWVSFTVESLGLVLWFLLCRFGLGIIHSYELGYICLPISSSILCIESCRRRCVKGRPLLTPQLQHSPGTPHSTYTHPERGFTLPAAERLERPARAPPARVGGP